MRLATNATYLASRPAALYTRVHMTRNLLPVCYVIRPPLATSPKICELTCCNRLFSHHLNCEPTCCNHLLSSRSATHQ